jgi:hypothetical protein
MMDKTRGGGHRITSSRACLWGARIRIHRSMMSVTRALRVWNTSSHAILAADYINTAVFCNLYRYTYLGCGLSFSIGYRAAAVASCASGCGTLRLNVILTADYINSIQPYFVYVRTYARRERAPRTRGLAVLVAARAGASTTACCSSQHSPLQAWCRQQAVPPM